MQKLLFIVITLVSLCCEKSQNFLLDDFPIKYTGHDVNALEWVPLYLNGIKSVAVGCIFIFEKESYTYNGCYCIVKGSWSQIHDTLYLKHNSIAHDTSKPFNPSINCFLLDSVFQVSNNGKKLMVLNNNKSVYEGYVRFD